MNNTVFLTTFVLIRFRKKTGKIDLVLESQDASLLEQWAMKNTSKTKDTIVFNKGNGDLECYLEGTDTTPLAHNEPLGNIEKYCPGLLFEIQRQSTEEE